MYLHIFCNEPISEPASGARFYACLVHWRKLKVGCFLGLPEYGQCCNHGGEALEWSVLACYGKDVVAWALDGWLNVFASPTMNTS